MLHRRAALLPLLLILLWTTVSCGGGSVSEPDPGPGPGPQPPAVTITEYETDAQGDVTLRVGGTLLPLTFVDNLTGEPLEGLYVEIAENDEDSILVVSDPFGEYATYSSFVDPASSAKRGVGRAQRSTHALTGFWGVDYVDDIMSGVPGVLSYVNPECWDAWFDDYADFDGDATIAGLAAWLDDLIDSETTAEAIHVIAAKPLDAPGGAPTYALLGGAATYDETVLTPWLDLWPDWYRQSCYDEDAPIAVSVTLYEGLLTVFLLPYEALPDAPVTYASIQGVVTDAQTRQPISDVFVVPSHLWMESITDPTGAYSMLFVDVLCDRHDEVIFVVEKPGYYSYGFTGAEAGLNGFVGVTHDVELEPTIPWTFYGPADFAPDGDWITSVAIDWVGPDLTWTTGAALTDAFDLLAEPLGVAVGDRIELEMRYLGHADPSAGQQLYMGFTGVRDVSGFAPAHFIGLRTADSLGDALTDVVVSNAGATSVPFGLIHAQDVPTTIRMFVLVESTTAYRVIVDQDGVERHNALHAGNLVGTTLSQCAVWNAPVGANPLAGTYDGSLWQALWRGTQD